MKVARVVGTVTATVHQASYDGQTLLLCAPVDARGAVVGDAFVAVDRAQAGVGDTVLVNAEGGGARLVFGRKLTDPLAIQDVIVGVVDAFHEE